MQAVFGVRVQAARLVSVYALSLLGRLLDRVRERRDAGART